MRRTYARRSSALTIGAAFILVGNAVVMGQTSSWTPGTNLLTTNPSATRVGIGTSVPTLTLEVWSAPWAWGKAIGNIQTCNSADAYSLSPKTGILFATKYTSSNNFAGFAGIVAGKDNSSDGNLDGCMYFTVRNSVSDFIEAMRIAPSGRVGIGTSNPQSQLAVNGTVTAKEVVVTSTGWSDFVFDKSYRLKPLSEVESHIKATRHLEGIPSAKEVRENGVPVGEMQAKLLGKVEELTLYVIDVSKQNEALRLRIAGLERQLERK